MPAHPRPTPAERTPDASPAPVAATMRAVVQHRYGDAARLRVEQVHRPGIAEHEVLVAVHAAGLSRGTWHLMTGQPWLLRLAFGLRGPRQRVIGQDLAGRVVAVGTAVTRFTPGDEVYGIGRGTFAEYAAAREDKLAHKPRNLTFEQASVAPVSGLTALQGLLDVGRLEAGQRVLITGASGGVGSHAVQIAKAAGAEVTAVCSAAKADLARSLGADHVLDHSREDFADGTRRYELILDIAGNPSLTRLRRALTHTGTAVIVGGEGGGRLAGGLDRQLRASVLSRFVGQRLTSFIATEQGSDLERLTELIEAGSLIPSVERTYPLERAAEAMEHLAAGRVRGKVALTL
ncbi:NAD(P)-dependent alcohol dehydrogenase [Nocardioides sp.]|uniref:NAD(P)-dependent alcohol dehydrogenase n=1 Tax=Nocardioides sp. TaxID=35761 RepID=UPI0027352D03|nr:NAD(P)-dependent alcohol dehydrogenase [Nocardioides sp.]MDP3892522.1 NAD(P)-dependent alcohol dehydrogenase [Nocardioides sp.]